MSLLYQKHASRPLTLDNRVEPELYRDVFPYTHVSRIEFDDTFLVPRPADPMFITDTTFRDGQQARPPLPSSTCPILKNGLSPTIRKLKWKTCI